MLHNEDEYPDPFAFKPERFLKDGKLNPNIRDPALMAFGFGRRWQWTATISEVVRLTKAKCRLCAGYHIAFSTFWLTAGSILATFNLSKAVDKDGRVIEPSSEYSTGLIRWVNFQAASQLKCNLKSWNSHPLPFGCSIKPRSPIAEELIRSAVDSFWPILPMRGRSLRNDFYIFSCSMYYLSRDINI